MTDTPNVKVLANGAVYDLDKKRIVSGAMLTSDMAKEMVQTRIQKKQERLIAGAAKVLERSGDWELPTDMDVVEAIGEAVMENAIDPTSKKQIEAAKFILSESGLSNSVDLRRENTQPGTITASAETMMQLLDMIEARQSAAVDKARAIDAE
jgi:hypothetical protein